MQVGQRHFWPCATLLMLRLSQESDTSCCDSLRPELPRIPILGRSCIKKPGSYRSDPGSLRIDFGLLAVLAVHGADARALVREAEFLPAAFLALLLRRWGSWATLHREGCASCC